MARADSTRNQAALLGAARELFATEGVDVSVRAIASRADLNTATLYRHFPSRSDLVAAVFHEEVDECAAEARTLRASLRPDEALEAWILHYAALIVSKPGLAAALHYRDPSFAGLPAYFQERLAPVLGDLLETAVEAGTIRDGIDPLDLLGAVAKLCIPPAGSDDNSRARRMISLLVDGLRHGAGKSR